VSDEKLGISSWRNVVEANELDITWPKEKQRRLVYRPFYPISTGGRGSILNGKENREKRQKGTIRGKVTLTPIGTSTSLPKKELLSKKETRCRRELLRSIVNVLYFSLPEKTDLLGLSQRGQGWREEEHGGV